MNSWMMIIFSVALLVVAVYCVVLMMRYNKKLGGIKGEPQGEELEDLDKMRSELLETNRKLRAEIERLKKELGNKGTSKKNGDSDVSI